MGTLRRRQGREVWTARYVDESGIAREVSTGCRDRGAAKQVLAGLEGRAEKVRAGIVSRQEARTAEWSGVPLEEHIEAHAAYMTGLGRAPRTVQDQRRLMLAVADGCGWKRASDLNRPRLERWLTAQVSEGMAARTRNAYAVASVAFGNWMVRAGRLAVNPFDGIPMMNVKADRRHERRALSMEEFSRLIDAAERRPLEEAARRRKLSPGSVNRLQWIGRTRKMVYATLMFTGLRYGELKSITIRQVHLEGTQPYIELRAADEKARRGAQVPLPAGLAAMLDEYVTERRSRLLGQRGAAAAFPGVLETAPLFDLAATMVHVFDNDLTAAGISKTDAQGRVLDIHALRHSFCTLVAQSGISMQHAQRLMRHATPAMTMKYTHLSLMDLGGAIATLPGLPKIAQPTIAAAAETASSLRPIQRPISACISSVSHASSCILEDQDGGANSEAESCEIPNIRRGSQAFEDGAGRGSRTPTEGELRRILSPVRLPISPPRPDSQSILNGCRWFNPMLAVCQGRLVRTIRSDRTATRKGRALERAHRAGCAPRL